MKNLRKFKGVFVGKNSELSEALEKSNKAAEKVFKETTKKF